MTDNTDQRRENDALQSGEGDPTRDRSLDPARQKATAKRRRG